MTITIHPSPLGSVASKVTPWAHRCQRARWKGTVLLSSCCQHPNRPCFGLQFQMSSSQTHKFIHQTCCHAPNFYNGPQTPASDQKLSEISRSSLSLFHYLSSQTHTHAHTLTHTHIQIDKRLTQLKYFSKLYFFQSKVLLPANT